MILTAVGTIFLVAAAIRAVDLLTKGDTAEN